MSNNHHENSFNYRDNNRRHHNNHRNNNNKNNETNIASNKLPSGITKYLGKNYPGYSVMLSKLKDDGYYYVKIKYNQNAYRPYYRDLVFDQKGNPIRG